MRSRPAPPRPSSGWARWSWPTSASSAIRDRPSGCAWLVALAACLTLAPALLRLFGPAVFWPFGPGESGPHDDDEPLRSNRVSARFWNWLSYWIIARPGFILAVSVLLMSTVIFASRQAFPGPMVHISYNLLEDLGPKRPSILGTRLVQTHFAPANLVPITVIAYKPPSAGGQRPTSSSSTYSTAKKARPTSRG